MSLWHDRTRYLVERTWLAWAFLPFGAFATAAALWFAALLIRPLSAATAFRWFSAAHISLMRGSGGPGSTRLRTTIEKALRRERAAATAVASNRSSGFSLDGPKANTAGIVLKAPRLEGRRVVERGVLLLKNTERIDAVRRAVQMGSLLDAYTLVLEPSWSGYASPAILSFTAYSPHRVVVMATCREDFEFLERFALNLYPIAIGASDWVNPQVFAPIHGIEKDFDAVMIARWNYVKRHGLLLRALHRIDEPGFRVALVATNTSVDSDRSAILDHIHRSGHSDQIAVFEDVDPAAVNVILNRSRVNLLLSLQEGSNRGLFEGFFAGTPAVALERNLGIPKPYFTAETGLLIDEKQLAATLRDRRHLWGEMDPRSWALANIAPELSTRKLNALLRRLAIESGEPWTRDIVAKCNLPNVRYYPDESVGSNLGTLREVLAAH